MSERTLGKTRLTLFTGTLVLDSALSVGGLDRGAAVDQAFAMPDGVPTLVGGGLKGAAVAMARRFFQKLPRAVSDVPANGALRRSIWEFAETTAAVTPTLRANVGMRHKTGARADRVLTDREVIPAGTEWPLIIRVDWSQTPDPAEAAEAEGILGYVLSKHWAEARCWLAAGNARGLGWCQLHELKAYRLDRADYERWVRAGRPNTPDVAALSQTPTATPTHAWSFRTLDLVVEFGEYRPEPDEPAWGLDMLAIGPHDSERALQVTGDGDWALPSWVAPGSKPEVLPTDRAMLMDRGRPALPGSSLRGPLRHAHARTVNAAGVTTVVDPHLVQGKVPEDDPGGALFGSVAQSSNVLIRDGRAEEGWAAARLHMHAEDEFSAGSWESAKRDAVRLLRGRFPVRIVVEGESAAVVDPLVQQIDREIAKGKLGHLPIGGHKMRGAGWGRWEVAKGWEPLDIQASPPQTASAESVAMQARDSTRSDDKPRAGSFPTRRAEEVGVWVRVESSKLDAPLSRLQDAAKAAREALGEQLLGWWCEPAIDLSLKQAPVTHGEHWPEGADLSIEEAVFFARGAAWRVAGDRSVLIQECNAEVPDAKPVRVSHTPAVLHADRRYAAADTGTGYRLLREWHLGAERLGFTLVREAI